MGVAARAGATTGRGVAVLYPDATQRAGPGWKQAYPPIYKNACRGVVCHSMVGSYAGAMGRLDSQDRASWHFSITKAGTVYQHYDTEVVAWHAGTPQWNQKLIGIEHEGGAPGNESEPLTAAQVAASTALVRWLSLQHGFPRVRGVGLFEHRELYATACPSGRIPWGEYEEGDMPTQQQWDQLVGDVRQTFGLAYRTAQAVTEIGNALARHIQEGAPAGYNARLDALQQEIDALEDAQKKAAAALGGN